MDYIVYSYIYIFTVHIYIVYSYIGFHRSQISIQEEIRHNTLKSATHKETGRGVRSLAQQSRVGISFLKYQQYCCTNSLSLKTKSICCRLIYKMSRLQISRNRMSPHKKSAWQSVSAYKTSQRQETSNIKCPLFITCFLIK